MAAPTDRGAQQAVAPSFVGREREQAALREALAAAQAGHGGLVLIGGEAGIGKTTLAEWHLAEAEERGALALVGRCYDLSETPPYGPWIEALSRAPRGESLPPPPDLAGDGVASREALLAAVRDYLAALVSSRPVIVLLDDLHWADLASLELLRYLARDLAHRPLLLLATYRADELTRRHPLYALLPPLVREARAVRLDLKPLDHAELHALVAARCALPPADQDRLVAHLAARAEGNPFFAGELLRALEEEAILRRGDGGWQLGDLAGATVPSLLRQVLDARLDRLGDDARALLAVAAVIGQRVPLDLWRAVAGVGEDALLPVVERAVEARLLAETRGNDDLHFAHALIREALYDGMVGLRRRALHRRAAEALAATAAPDPDAVAHHLQRAGDSRAAEWLERAAERARRTYAWDMAADRLAALVAHAERAGTVPGERAWLLLRLGLLRRATDPRQAALTLDSAAALAAASDQVILAASARFAAGLARCYVWDYAAGVAAMAAALPALEALPSLDAETRARLRGWGLADDPAHHRGTLALCSAIAGQLAEAVALGARVPVSEVPPGGAWLDAAFAPDALRGVGLAQALFDRPAEARAAFDRNLAAYLAIGDQGQAGGTASMILWHVLLPFRADDLAERRRVAAEMERLAAWGGGTWTGEGRRLWSAPLLLVEGRWAEVRALTARAGPHPFDSAARLRTLIPLAVYQGDYALALSLAPEAFPAGTATRPGDGGLAEVAALFPHLGVAALGAGAAEEARAWLDSHQRLLDAADAVLGRAEGHLGWAAYHRATGNLSRAREHAARALTHASEPRQPLALLAAHRTRGELDTETARYGEAERHLEAALSLAGACAAPYERALTLLALAELRAAEGRQPEADTALAEARAILVPLEAHPALARADALAARLVAPAPAPATPINGLGLTARETEVLRLVAQGLSNAEVGDRLFLSPRTVGQHLRSIYNKLGVDNRTAATRLATQHGLVGEGS